MVANKKYLKLADIGAYSASFKLSNEVWREVRTWDVLAKKTIGEQMIKSVDSCSANIAEGFGRYGKKDKIKFYRYTLGSLYESQDWFLKAKARGLFTEEVFHAFHSVAEDIRKKTYSLINYTNEKLAF